MQTTTTTTTCDNCKRVLSAAERPLPITLNPVGGGIPTQFHVCSQECHTAIMAPKIAALPATSALASQIK